MGDVTVRWHQGAARYNIEHQVFINVVCVCVCVCVCVTCLCVCVCVCRLEDFVLMTLVKKILVQDRVPAAKDRPTARSDG